MKKWLEKYSLGGEIMNVANEENPIAASGGNIIKDNNGYRDPKNWGHPVEINSSHITMNDDSIPYRAIRATDELGNTQIIPKGYDAIFPGKHVRELPIALNGISQESDRNGSQLGQLTDFSNKQNKANWLNKYK